MDVEEIAEVDSLDSLGSYLCSLGYSITRIGERYGIEIDPRKDLELPKAARSPIRSLLLLADYDKLFQIYFAELEKLGRTQIRPIVESFYRKYPQADWLFIFTTDFSEIAFVSAQRITEATAEKPRIRLRILNVDRSNIYHTDLQVLRSIILPEGMKDPSEVWKKHLEAFNIERVTKEFFDDYKEVMGLIMKTLQRQKASKFEAKEFAQQLLNRLMLLYFLQRKGWLEMNGESRKRYLRYLWLRYLEEVGQKNRFYKDWLYVLFFNAFNGEGLEGIDLPEDVLESFRGMPYLNGGLFQKYEYDEKGYKIPDHIFKSIFGTRQVPGLLEKYNFTVREDTPLEVEVAIDPEMLGKVYESLVLEEEREGRRKAGIFYTPRTEVDFMCRQSVMEYLRHHTNLSYDTLLRFVYEPDDLLKDVDTSAIKKIEDLLNRVKIVDPGCGSGAFLVGMLYVLEELRVKVVKRLGNEPEEPFELRNRIVRRNLYGADIKGWAVRVAELRLWLTLIVEAGEEILQDVEGPVLPNLTFRLRIGDSLVQEVGGRPLAARALFQRPSKRIIQMIKGLSALKEQYYSGAGDRALENDIRQREIDIFLHAIKARIDELERKLRRLAAVQQKLTTTQTAIPKDEKEIKGMKAEIRELERLKAEIAEEQERAFFWEVDFAEVFFADGFDIVIGNPPYVRQEKIVPLMEAAGFSVPKAEYKRKLFENASAFWGEEVERRGRSDLYVYFYYQGMALLKEGGVLCLISSNSWLDVGFGGALQAFLLRNSQILGVFDNLSIRSFKQADVNTIIVLARRSEERELNAENKVRFVAFRVPWADVRSGEVLRKVYGMKEVKKRKIPNLSLKFEYPLESYEDDDLRVRLVKQSDLWLDGLEVMHEMRVQPFTGSYGMNKWGGKFIRAPDIFYTILEKGKGKLVPLGEIAEVRRGFTTGANEFFYLRPTGQKAAKGLTHLRNGMGWEGYIEDEYVVPVVKSPREVEAICIPSEDLQHRAFMCNVSKKELKRSGKNHALAYVRWGEHQRSKGHQGKQKAGILLPKLKSFVGREEWYMLGRKKPCHFLCNRFFNDRIFFAFPSSPSLEDQTFYGGRFREGIPTMAQIAILNSTLQTLFASLLGRVGLGEGVLQYAVYEMKELLTLNSETLSDSQRHELEKVITRMARRPVLSIFEEILAEENIENLAAICPDDISLDRIAEDRRGLDTIVFRALNLSDQEQLQVYQGAVELVRDRLAKAESV